MNDEHENLLPDDPTFMGTITEWADLAASYGLELSCVPIWKGIRTALFVVSYQGGEVPDELLATFRAAVKEHQDVGSIITVTSVG